MSSLLITLITNSTQLIISTSDSETLLVSYATPTPNRHSPGKRPLRVRTPLRIFASFTRPNTRTTTIAIASALASTTYCPLEIFPSKRRRKDKKKDKSASGIYIPCSASKARAMPVRRCHLHRRGLRCGLRCQLPGRTCWQDEALQ